MIVKSFLIFLITLVYFDVSAAEKLTVYRWIDKNNVVHFSQQQPDHDNYIEINMANSKKLPTDLAENSSPDASQKNDNLPVQTDVENGVNHDGLINDKCVIARQNLNTLQKFDKVQYKSENGKVTALTALERQQQLAMNTKQIEVYCND